VAAFENGLKELGWKSGGNIDLDNHWPGAALDQVSVAANERRDAARSCGESFDAGHGHGD
jgi:hypothetical protein